MFSVYRPCICLYIYITSLHIEGYNLYMYRMNIYILVNKTLLQYCNTATLNCKAWNMLSINTKQVLSY